MHPHSVLLHTPHNDAVCIVMTYIGINKLLTAMQVVRSNFPGTSAAAGAAALAQREAIITARRTFR